MRPACILMVNLCCPRIRLGEPDFVFGYSVEPTACQLHLLLPRIHDQIERFSVVRDEFSAPPKGVRKYRIQKSPFLVDILLFVQCVRLSRQFESSNAHVHVAAVCPLMRLDSVQDIELFSTPFLASAVTQKLFQELALIFPDCNEDEKEKLVDAVLKRAAVDKEKAVEFEFYAGDGMDDVVQYAKVGSPNRTFARHRDLRIVKVRTIAHQSV